MRIYVEHWEDDLAKLIIFRYWGDEIGLYGKFSTSMKYIGGMRPDFGGIHPLIFPGLAPMIIEFPKNIDKSRDKSYPTDQKTSSILVPTVTHCPEFFFCKYGNPKSIKHRKGLGIILSYHDRKVNGSTP